MQEYRSMSLLVQRLLVPEENHKENVFEFGAGYLRGGLSKKAYRAVNSVFNFDYMGAAEYEWGAVPEALDEIGKAAREKDMAVGEMRFGDRTVFYICRSETIEDVRAIIDVLARTENDKDIRARHPVGLAEALRRESLHIGDVAGWLELNNHFMFFVSKEMFEGSARLFGINVGKIPIEAKLRE